MGISNSTQNLRGRVARWKGERDEKQKAIEHIEAGVAMLESLRQRIAKLDELITSAEQIVQEDVPDFDSEAVKSIRTTNRDSPIPYGLLGRTALEVMRDLPPEGLTARDITRKVFARFNLDPADRALLDRKSNSLSNYFKANEGDLVESDNAPQYRRWRLIRSSKLTAVR